MERDAEREMFKKEDKLMNSKKQEEGEEGFGSICYGN